MLIALHCAHLGIRKSIEATSQKIEVWLDTIPPTVPRSLTGGLTPKILRAASYINRTFLTKHSTAPFDSTGGDMLVAFASSHGGVALTPSDNFDNVWIPLTSPTSTSVGFDLRSQIWYAKNPKVGPNHIFTVTLSAAHSLAISLFVVKGSDVSGPIDAVSTIGDDAATQTLTPTSPRITTTRPDDLLIGFAKSAASEVWNAGSGFMLQQEASSDFLAAESGPASAPGNYNSIFTISDPADWQASVIAIKSAAHVSLPQIMLGWQASSDNVAVAGYRVQRCSGADCSNFIQIGTSKDPAFVDSMLPKPMVYRYRVQARDAASNASGYSNAIAVNAAMDGE
jgi:hypothetical protein